MSARRLHYLGPEGTFTHEAAIAAAAMFPCHDDIDLMPCGDAASIVRAVAHGDGWGVIAWENNVEGYVVPNLDMLIDAEDVAGFARVGVDVTFSAFVTEETYVMALAQRGAGESEFDAVCRVCTTVSAHPHGLAQCRRFIRAHHLREMPAASNGAACRDLAYGCVALGPDICGRLYGLHRITAHVEDFQGARTEFLVIARRDDVRTELASARSSPRSSNMATGLRRSPSIHAANGHIRPSTNGCFRKVGYDAIWRPTRHCPLPRAMMRRCERNCCGRRGIPFPGGGAGHDRGDGDDAGDRPGRH